MRLNFLKTLNALFAHRSQVAVQCGEEEWGAGGGEGSSLLQVVTNHSSFLDVMNFAFAIWT